MHHIFPWDFQINLYRVPVFRYDKKYKIPLYGMGSIGICAGGGAGLFFEKAVEIMRIETERLIIRDLEQKGPFLFGADSL